MMRYLLVVCVVSVLADGRSCRLCSLPYGCCDAQLTSSGAKCTSNEHGSAKTLTFNVYRLPTPSVIIGELQYEGALGDNPQGFLSLSMIMSGTIPSEPGRGSAKYRAAIQQKADLDLSVDIYVSDPEEPEMCVVSHGMTPVCCKGNPDRTGAFACTFAGVEYLVAPDGLRQGVPCPESYGMRQTIRGGPQAGTIMETCMARINETNFEQALELEATKSPTWDGELTVSC